MAQAKIDKRLYRRVGEAFVRMACDSYGEPINGKALDRVMYDILGQQNFFSRICNMTRDVELQNLFNGCNVMEIVSIIENEKQLDILYSMLELDKEIFSIKKKIKRLTKKGKKCKGLKERYQKLSKIYKKAIKAFRDLLNVRTPKKGNGKPSKKYSNIVNFSKRMNGSYGIYDEIFGGEYDDDDEDFFGNGYADDLVVDRGRNKVYRGFNPTNIFGDEDLEDDDEEDDDDDYGQNIEDQLEVLRDMCTKNLSGLGSVIALLQGQQVNVPAMSNLPTVQPSFNGHVDIDEDDDDDEEDRLDRLERIVLGMCDKIDRITDSVSQIEPDQYTDAERAMALLFSGDEEEEYAAPDPDNMEPTVTMVEEEVHMEVVPVEPMEAKDYAAMNVAEVIDEKNASK